MWAAGAVGVRGYERDDIRDCIRSMYGSRVLGTLEEGCARCGW